jgi:hypothetical protein
LRLDWFSSIHGNLTRVGGRWPAGKSGLYFSRPVASVILDTNECFAVEDSAGIDEAKDFGEGDEEEIDALVLLRLGVAESEFFGQEDLHPLAEEAGAGEVTDEGCPLLGAITGFFDELAFGGSEAGFVAVDLAGGKFVHVLAGSVAILPLEDDERIAFAFRIVDREDDDRSVMANHVAGGLDAVGFDDVVAEDFEERAFILKGRGEDLRDLWSLWSSCFLERFHVL